MLPRLALALCLVLAGCALTTKTPLRVVRDTNDRALSWAIGGVYDTLNGHLTITADGAVVANGSFGALDSELRLAGAYQGYAIAALCKRLRDNSAHVGSTSVKCEVSVADSSIGTTVRSVQLGPDVDREAIGSLTDSSAPYIANYDADTGRITVTTNGTVVAEGTFPATATEVQLRGVYQDNKVTALCVKEQASGMTHDNVRCSVTEDETVAQGATPSTAGDIPPAQLATEQPSAARATRLQPAGEQASGAGTISQPVAEQPAPAGATSQLPAKQPVATQTTLEPVAKRSTPARPPLRSCSGPQCIHIEPQTYHLATNPDTAWVIAGDYDSVSSRLTLTINGAPVVQGRFGVFDLELQIGNEYQGHKISASCTKSHGSLASSALKCTVFVDQERAVVLQKET
jgi:hypothetical protein